MRLEKMLGPAENAASAFSDPIRGSSIAFADAGDAIAAAIIGLRWAKTTPEEIPSLAALLAVFASESSRWAPFFVWRTARAIRRDVREVMIYLSQINTRGI